MQPGPCLLLKPHGRRRPVAPIERFQGGARKDIGQPFHTVVWKPGSIREITGSTPGCGNGFRSEHRRRQANGPILSEPADVGDGVDEHRTTRGVHLGGRLLKAKMDQIALPPERRRTRRFLIDTATKEFDFRRIIEFIIIRTPTSLVVVDDRVITLDAVHQRQDIHLLHFQFANKGFRRRDADSRLCVNGQWRLEYLVVA